MGQRMGFPVVALGGIEEITSTGGSITITNPTGPDTNIEVTSSGGGVGEVLALTYNGVGPFNVPCLVPEGYSTVTGGEIFGVIIVGAGGITSGMLLLPNGSPVADGSYPSYLFVSATGIIEAIVITDLLDGQILFYGTIANLLSLGFPLSGSGSPQGVVLAPSVGTLYIDTSSGGLYISEGTDSTSWIAVGGFTVPGSVGGVISVLGTTAIMNAETILSDLLAIVGSFNGAIWNGNGSDGAQTFVVQVGPAGSPLKLIVGADGSLTCPQNIIAPALPTSPVGLPSGAFWNNLGIVNVAP